jgi:hypothetical protein
MHARTWAFSLVLFVTLAASAFFVCYPTWDIEHPAEPALVLSSQRAWIWSHPAHAHIDGQGAAIPVAAILMMGIVLGFTLRKPDD